jgi:hypothetical protein
MKDSNVTRRSLRVKAFTMLAVVAALVVGGVIALHSSSPSPQAYYFCQISTCDF